MEAPLISIIIPVYNSAPYLADCLNSLLQQDFPAWEAICINDGSTDGSKSILCSYASQDSRIHVFEQQNAGVSAARNRGIEEAGGAYLCMVDSDDCLPSKALSALAAPILSDRETDFVTGGMLWIHSHPTYSEQARPSLTYGAQVEGFFTSTAFAAQHVSGLACGKLYRRSIITQEHLRYDTSLRIGEDQEFTLRFLMHAHRMVAVNAPVYHYIIRGESAMGAFQQGRLPLKDYLSFATNNLRLSEALPTGWAPEEKLGFNRALLLYFWRNLFRGLGVLAPRDIIRCFSLMRQALQALHQAPIARDECFRAFRQLRTWEAGLYRQTKSKLLRHTLKWPIYPLYLLRKSIIDRRLRTHD